MKLGSSRTHWLLAAGLFALALLSTLGSCGIESLTDSGSDATTTEAVEQEQEAGAPSSPRPTATPPDQLPPPAPTDEVFAFNARRGTWESALLEDVRPGGELIHAGRLFRLRGDAGFIQWNNDVDVEQLSEADATWDPEAVHRYPGAEDVVYVTGDDARHVLLPQVRDGEEFAFQGRIFETRISGGEFSVRPTGLTLNRVTETFRRNTDTLVDLSIEYVEGGVTATITGTPEHPFFVPAVGDYVAMGELTPGTALRTDDGSQARVVGSQVRHGDFEVFNLEVENAHNYFVSAPWSDGPGVLVHNTCFRGLDTVPSWRSRPNWGHTFDTHGAGARTTRRLTGRAGGTGQSQGQWLDNDTATQHIFDQARTVDISTPTHIPLPEGLGQVIMPDGSIVPATRALVVPNGRGGVRTAFPVLGD